MKKILSILLVVLMLVGMLPVQTLHVHAAESKYVKVTTAPSDWSGEYLIVYETGKVIFDGSLKADAAKNTQSVTISDNTITADSKYSFTIAKSGSSYTIKAASGSYIGNTANSNKLTYSTSALTNTISLNGDGTAAIVSSGGAYLRFNAASDQMRFRYYKSSSYTGQKAICLYKLEEASSCEHTNTTTTTVDATCTTAGSTTVTCTDCGEVVSSTEIPAQHSYDAGVVTPPSCTAAGYTTYTCTACGATKTDDETAATGHSYADGVCQSCGAKLPTVSFSVPSQVAGVNSLIANDSGIVTLPAADNYSVAEGAKLDYTFYGWIEQSLNADQTEVPTVHKAGEQYTPSGDVTLYAVYTYSVAGSGTAGYNKTELSAIAPTDKVVIVATKTGTYAGDYAISNNNGTGSAPTAVEVTVDGNTVTADSFENILWNIEKSGSNYIIYPDGTTSKWLYCTGTNNGVRVGTNTNKTFVLDASGYLKHVSTSRYLGVYNKQDWRCYSTNTGTSNIANQTFAFYVEGQGDTTYYTSTLESADVTCTHTNTTSTTIEPSCTVDGKTTVTCADCGAFISETVIEAPGHTEVTDEAKAPTCVDTGLTEGSHCSVCNTVIKEQETIAATGEHTYVDGSCSVCGAAKPAGGATAWVLVEDPNSLAVGDKIVIVSATDNNALSTEQKTNNRGVIAITKDTENKTVAVIDGVQILTLVEGTSDGTFGFSFVDENGNTMYLYAGSASGNQLKSKATLDDHGSWKITITDSVTSVIATNSSNRNVMQYNYNNGSPLFACYTSAGQKAVEIYKETILCDHETVEDLAAVAPTCESVGYTAGKQCADCGEITEGHEEIAALGHSWDEGVVTTPATCEAAGEKTVTCQNDQTHTKTEVIPALGHAWNEGEVTKAATCEEAGEKTITCQNDNSHVNVVEIPALGHDWNEGDVIKAATCEEAGEKLLTCQNDSNHTKIDVIPAAGHNYDTNGVCGNCGKKVQKFVLVDDYTTILAGGEYIIAARSGDSFYAISTSSTTINPAAQAVTVAGSGADMYVTYAEGLPIWKLEYDPYNTHAFTLYNPERELYLHAKDQAFVAAKAEPWSWSFKDASNEGDETDGVYAVSYSDGATAFVVVSDTIVDRAIGLTSGNDTFKTQSLRGQDINVELFFFKAEEEQEESYTVTFVEDGTVTMTQQVSADENVLKMPKPVNSTMPEGYTKFVGWVNLPYMETLIAPPNIYSAEDGEGVNNVASINGNTTFYALYSREDPNAEGETMSYHLVTNENQLVVGEKYIIVAIDKEGNYHAMSKDQLSDDRGTSPVQPDADGVITFLPEDNVGVFMLMQGFSAGSFGFLDVNLDKFLYCSSSGTNNSLKSQSTMDAASSFFITVDSSDYVSTIAADVSSARNTMLFNPQFNLISSYSPALYAGLDLYLYVGMPNSTFATYYTTGLCPHNWETTSKEASCTEPGYTMQTCTICGKVEMLEFAAHGHDVGSQVVITPPTCTTTGLARSTCNKCNSHFDEVLPALGHTPVVDAAAAPTCTETGLTEGSHCETCGIVLVAQQVVAALGHSYDEGVVTPPTITEDGYTTYTCTVCGHQYIDNIVPAIGPLKFVSATLALEQNLSIGFRANASLFAPGAYYEPYAVFTFGYETVTVTEYTVVGDRWEFICPDITPSQMTEQVSATLYAKFNGEDITGETKIYSVTEYCTGLLNTFDDEALHTLVVDLLYFGDQASIYANYRTEEPATSILTAEQKALHTTAVPELSTVVNSKYAVIDNPAVTWKAVTLVLDESVEIRYRLAVDSIEGLTAKITAGGKEWTVDTFKPVPGEDGQYYLAFNKLTACMMREEVLVTIYQGDTVVSNTVCYSIESYAYAKQNDPRIGLLVLEMMRYGDSTYNYFMKEDK